MAESVGQIGLDLVVNKNGFDKQMRGINGLAKKAAVALASAFAVKKLVDFGKSAVNLGSQLAEVDNVIQQAVPSMEKKIDSFAKNAIEQFGMSEIAAKRFTGVFSSMARGFGFSEKAAATMGVTLTSLAADVASFYDTSQDEAFTKLKSIFSGETESLKGLGVVMTQNALDAYALANGYKKTTKNMSEAEKVALRYAFVQEKLRFAQGDFARNSDSWANQIRILSERFNALKATIGQGLINALLPVIRLMNTLLGKIQAVATAFSNLTAKVFGKAEQGASSVATATEEIGNAAEGATDGIEKASKAAKKAANSASSIDELNIAQSDDKDEAGAIGIGIDDIALQAQETAKEIETPMSLALGRIKGLCVEIGEAFNKGFVNGTKNVNFDKIKLGLDGIKTSLQSVFSDSDVEKSATRFITTFSESIGSKVGMLVTAGTSIATNLISAVDRYLSENSEFIKTKFINLFDTGTRFADITIKVNDFLGEISTILTSETAIGITSNLIEIFSNGFLNVVDLASTFAVDFIDMVVSPILDNSDKIKEAIEKTLIPIEKVTTSIKDFVYNTFETVFAAYDKYIKPAFNNFKEGLSTIIGSILDAYNRYLAPTIDRLSDRFSWLMNSIIQPFVDAVVGLAGRIIEFVSIIWKAISPFVGWIAEVLIAGLSSAFETLWTVFEFIFSAISNAVTTIINVFSGLIDFVIGVFTGDWDRAWGGIKSIFTSIWDGIKKVVDIAINFIRNIISTVMNTIKSHISTVLDGIKLVFTNVWDGIKKRISFVTDAIKLIISGFMSLMHNGISGTLNNIKTKFVDIFNSIKDKVTTIFSGMWSNIKGVINSILAGIEGMANGVVRGVNKVIGALNGLSFEVPDWIPGLGGKSFGFSIPTLSEVNIPRLAQGGFVKANTPQLVMVGDNRHQGEVIAPEDKMLEMAMKAAELVNGNKQNDVYMPVIIELLSRIIEILEALDLNLELDGKSVLKGLKETQARLGFEF